jgi:hypothetical protein
MDDIPFIKIMESMKPKTPDDIKPHGSIIKITKKNERALPTPVNRDKLGIDDVEIHGSIIRIVKYNERDQSTTINRDILGVDIKPHGSIIKLKRYDEFQDQIPISQSPSDINNQNI